VDDNLVAFP